MGKGKMRKTNMSVKHKENQRHGTRDKRKHLRIRLKMTRKAQITDSSGYDSNGENESQMLAMNNSRTSLT